MSYQGDNLNNNEHQNEFSYHFHHRWLISYLSNHFHKALFHFHAPEECGKKFTCKVYMDYIHSWNMKHFGDTKCSLFSIDSSSHATTPIGHDLDIIGHLGGEGKTMQTTVPLSHMVTDQNIVGGSYLLQCQVMVEKRVSCIPRVQIRYNYSM